MLTKAGSEKGLVKEPSKPYVRSLKKKLHYEAEKESKLEKPAAANYPLKTVT